LKTVMVIIKSSPKEEPRVEEGLRVSAAMIGMDYPQKLVFLDQGVECLRPGVLDDSDIRDYLKATADLSGIYVLSDSMKERGLHIDDLDPTLSPTPVAVAELAEMSRKSYLVIAL